MLYWKDLIDERDEYIKLHSAVIKWWQIHYLTREERNYLLEEERRLQKITEQPEKKSEDLLRAEEVIARLQREKEEDDEIKQDEINKALAKGDLLNESNYNAATGSYSGAYGQNVTLDKEGLNQVDSILKEKGNSVEALLASMGL